MNLTPDTIASCDQQTQAVQEIIAALNPQQQDQLWVFIRGVLVSGLNGKPVEIDPRGAQAIADLALAGLYLLIMREQERIDQEEQGEPT